ncbi:MAG: type I DNA topoisomerase [Pseudomonadales bacterium]|jgi:DNA topoisomerase-1|nr:type I DNA topoisomerase [Pseudomonadales bacterium]MCP5337679.1 type I DNA topoisomerase [Pseudomonadales bacterium]
MGKALVIVESPAKAKTINKYLGRDFVVKSSIGHIRDLPVSGSASAADAAQRARSAAATRKMSEKEKLQHRADKAREQLVKRMGVDPAGGWRADYQILPGKEKVVAELRKAASAADAIYLATDLDREGEAIAWHLREAIGGDPQKYRRVVFNEITRSAIREAFERPAQIDIDRVNAQQARRFLDRVVGYMLSPLLWEKVARGLSAGRVQSVAVRLLVDREREIRAFVPEEYWEVHAETSTAAGASLRLEVRREGEHNFRPGNRAQAERAIAALQQARYVVKAREDKPARTRSSPPFITSTLQQAASTRLGFSVKKTMTLAQRLYEAGFITYMRTDSTNLSAEAVAACRDFIVGEHGPRYLPERPNVYASKSGAQEAHEAIRPSDVRLEPDALSGMERDAVRLYELVWRQFVACQMVPAEFLGTTLDVAAGDFELRARGRILRFDGFLRVLPLAGRKDEDVELPDVKVDEELRLLQLLPSQHFTKAPARYTEATLVRELEKRGIGRPSTYASIISTIQERGYARVESRRFYAEKLGDIVTDRLAEKFTNLMDYGFTANMEEFLDQIASGERDWIKVLDDFYADFSTRIEAAKGAAGGMRGNEPVGTSIACPACGRPMQIRTGSTGVFLGCSGYALPPAERCKETINLVHGDEVVHDEGDEDEEAESRVLRTRHRCARCGTAMDSYLVDATRKLHVCGNNPDCPGYEIESGRFKLKGYEGPVIPCDKCGADMQLKTGRFGKYFGCTASGCNNTRKLLRNGQAAPPRMPPVPMPHLRCAKVDDFYVLRDGASGLFLAASRFPKNRETRAPLVEELRSVRDQIDPKHAYLLDAPARDDAGNPVQVRYSRKMRRQYVTSEVDGKPTGWRAYHRDGKWVVSKDD